MQKAAGAENRLNITITGDGCPDRLPAGLPEGGGIAASIYRRFAASRADRERRERCPPASDFSSASIMRWQTR
jgi:hypothetical protein